MASTRTVHYFSADGTEGSACEPKGEVVINAVTTTTASPLELSFEVRTDATCPWPPPRAAAMC